MLSVEALTVVINNRPLFEDLSFNYQGGVLCIVGPSGAGKTTLLKSIAQLVPYTSGNMTLHGQTPKQLGFPKWRLQVLYVPQRPPVLEGTPLDFVDKQRTFQAQHKTPLNPVDIGLEWRLSRDLWTKPFGQLSGGEIQRIYLAIALSLQPEILLLDEPTSALDPETCLLVENTLRNKNCIWITHDKHQKERVAHDTLILGNELV